MEPDFDLILGADVFRNQVELGDRDIKGIAFVVLQLDIILDNPLHIQLMDAFIQADAVGGVNDVIARRQLGQAVDFGALVFAAPRFPTVRRDASVGNDGESGFRKIRPGR